MCGLAGLYRPRHPQFHEDLCAVHALSFISRSERRRSSRQLRKVEHLQPSDISEKRLRCQTKICNSFSVMNIASEQDGDSNHPCEGRWRSRLLSGVCGHSEDVRRRYRLLGAHASRPFGFVPRESGRPVRHHLARHGRQDLDVDFQVGALTPFEPTMVALARGTRPRHTHIRGGQTDRQAERPGRFGCLPVIWSRRTRAGCNFLRGEPRRSVTIVASRLTWGRSAAASNAPKCSTSIPLETEAEAVIAASKFHGPRGAEIENVSCQLISQLSRS